MSDPASLILTFGARGLSNSEAVAMLTGTPAGATLTIDVSQPAATGGKRYAVVAENLSAGGAQTLANHFLAHLEAVANEPPPKKPLPVLRCGQLSVHAPHVVDYGPDQPRNCPGVTP